MSQVDISAVDVKSGVTLWEIVVQVAVEYVTMGFLTWVAIWGLAQFKVEVPGQTWWWIVGLPVGLNLLYFLLRLYKAFWRVLWISNVTVHFTNRSYVKTLKALAFPPPYRQERASQYFMRVASMDDVAPETKMAATLLLGAVNVDTSFLEHAVVNYTLSQAVEAYFSASRRDLGT